MSLDGKTSRAKGPYGRGTTFGLPTSGHKAWMPVRFAAPGDTMQEGYKNVLTNQEVRPPGGFNDPPPGLTGEKIRHTTDAFRAGYEQIRWNKEADHAERQ